VWFPVSSPSFAGAAARLVRGAAIVVWSAVAVSCPVARAQTSSVTAVDDDKRCLQCHGREHIAELNPAERLSMVGTWLETEQRPADWVEPHQEVTGDEPPTRPGLFIRKDALVGSVHADIRCVQCHEDARQLPHQPKLNTQTCATSCHAKEAEAFPTGSHYEALKRGDAAAPTCASCHGGHQIMAISDQRSPEHRLNSIFLCSECHEKHEKDTPGGYKSKSHIEAYLQSAHGKAIAQSGLVAAPTCSDCHSAHAVHPVSDPSRRCTGTRIAQTCGRCHVGILGIYQKSMHGSAGRRG
jgi:hypothetical protein